MTDGPEPRGVAPDGERPVGETRVVRVEGVEDLRDDQALDSRAAEALAVALPPPPGHVAFRLPLVLAEESVLEPVEGSDRVFVAEPVAERETDAAHYVRQDRRGCWIPKGEVTAYELADDASTEAEPLGDAFSNRSGSESA